MIRENGKLLVRIDERVKSLFEDSKEAKDDRKEIFGALKDHHGRIKVIEAERNSPVHNFLRLIGLFK